MKMKKILALLLALVMVFALTACGNNSANSGNNANANANSNAGNSGGGSSGSGLPYEGQKLTVLYMSGVYADAARSMVDEFKAATGADVDVIDMPYTELHQKILLDATSNAGTYDVVDVASQWDGEFAPFMTPLTDYIAKDGYDTGVFIQNVLDNCGIWQGTFYGIPNASTPQLFAYRTDVYPDGLADNWEDYLEQAKAATKDGFYGNNIAGITGQLGGVFDYILWSKGGAWADENWNVTIDSQETREALQYLKDLNDSGAINPNWLNWGVDESIQDFLNGNSGICETWPSLGLVQNADDPSQSKVVGKWALSVIPHAKTGLTLLSAWDVAIPASSQNKDLAWEWIKMYTDYDHQVQFYNDFVILSPRVAFWEMDGIKGTYMDTLREALDTANMWWRVAASTEVDTMLNTEVSAFISGQQDLETTVAHMDSSIRQALANNPIEEGIVNYNH